MADMQRCHSHLEPKGILLLELPNHAVEIGRSNNSQEIHQNEDQSAIVVIQSAVRVKTGTRPGMFSGTTEQD